MKLKKLFEVNVRNDQDPQAEPKTLLILADDEDDARSLAEVRKTEVDGLIEIPGLVTAVGPSRLIGWTRTM